MEPERSDALADLRSILDATGHSVVLVGAYAREVTFDRAVGRATQRVTLDIDAAIPMRDWSEFEQLADAITASGHFRRIERDGLTFTHRNGTEIDLLPHGDIANQDRRLCWPNDATRSLSVEGFDELSAHVVLVAIGSIKIAVADLPALVALKLFAFDDRAEHTRKDLEDLVFMLRHATESLEDRVFSELDSTILSEYAYLDYGPLLLGIELRRRLASASLHRLRAIVRAAGQRAVDLPAVYRGEGADGPVETSRRFEALWVGLGHEGD